MPRPRKIAAAMPCTSFTGMRAAMRSPSSTAGTLAIIMPSVVPATTATSIWYCAASATVATWVLSPISARKKAISVAPNTPKRGSLASSSSSLSGISVHTAIAMKDRPSTQRSVCGPISVVSQVPTAAAKA